MSRPVFRGAMFLGCVLAVARLWADPVDVAYDVVIRNGKIVDGTGNPWFDGDIAVRGDRIVQIGRRIRGRGKREIDARGLVVSPGFIDIHSHSDNLLLQDGLAQSKIRQGVTTEILGEGRSAGPAQGRLAPRSVDMESGCIMAGFLSGIFARG